MTELVKSTPPLPLPPLSTAMTFDEAGHFIAGMSARLRVCYPVAESKVVPSTALSSKKPFGKRPPRLQGDAERLTDSG